MAKTDSETVSTLKITPSSGGEEKDSTISTVLQATENTALKTGDDVENMATVQAQHSEHTASAVPLLIEEPCLIINNKTRSEGKQIFGTAAETRCKDSSLSRALSPHAVSMTPGIRFESALGGTPAVEDTAVTTATRVINGEDSRSAAQLVSQEDGVCQTTAGNISQLHQAGGTLMFGGQNTSTQHNKYTTTNMQTNYFGDVVHSGLEQIKEQSKAELAEDKDLFVKTPSYQQALSMLDRGGVLVITGPPGSGKSSIARGLLRYYQTQEHEALILHSFKEWRMYVGSKGKKQIVLLTHVLGKVFTESEQLREMEKVIKPIQGLAKQRQCKTVVTMYKHILQDSCMKGSKLCEFPILDLCQTAHLPKTVKLKMLQNHLGCKAVSDAELQEICSVDDRDPVFPQCCARYARTIQCNQSKKWFPKPAVVYVVFIENLLHDVSHKEQVISVLMEIFCMMEELENQHGTKRLNSLLVAQTEPLRSTREGQYILYNAGCFPCRVVYDAVGVVLGRTSFLPDLLKLCDTRFLAEHVYSDNLMPDWCVCVPHDLSERAISLKKIFENIKVENLMEVQDLLVLFQNAEFLTELENFCLGMVQKGECQQSLEIFSLALFVASAKGWDKVVQTLLQHSVQTHIAQEWKCKSLFIASLTGHAEVVKIVSQHGASVESYCDEETILYLINQDDNMQTVKMLLRYRLQTGSLNEKGSRPLHIASQNGHVEVVKVLLQHDAQVDSLNVNNWTPLHRASLNGHVEVVKVLLQHGAQVDSHQKQASTPLHIASQNGHVELMKVLLQRGTQVDSLSVDNWTPLHIVSQNGYVEIVKVLLQHGAQVDSRQKQGSTPLHLASQNGHVEVVKVLLQHGAQVDSPNVNNWTPLHRASHNGHVEVVKVLLQHGATVDSLNINSWTPLHAASRNGRVEVVKMLLQHGAHVESLSVDSWTPLHSVSQNGHPEIVKVLLQHGAQVDSRQKQGSTPLHLASQNGHVEVVEVLIQHGAQVDSVNVNKLTPLHRASINGCVKVVKVLLEHGAIKDSRDKQGSTPLHMASYCGYVEVVAVLLQYGAHVNSLNVDRWTPLHTACRNGCVAAAEVLLQYGARIGSTTLDGVTPLRIASENGDVELVVVLLQHGAEVDCRQSDGTTPLHIASQNGHVEVVKMLLHNGAQSHSKDRKKITPLKAAKMNRHWEVVKVLQQNS